MRPQPDHAALLAGLHGVLETANAGQAGLSAIRRLLDVAVPALGARGTTFAEYGPAGGRVTAATDALQWTVGRPIPAEYQVLRPPGERTWARRIADVRCPMSRELLGRDLHGLLGGYVSRGDRVIGEVCAYYRDEGPAGPEHHAMLAFVASFAAQLHTGTVRPPVENADRNLALAVTSHELRTPITVIKGFADTLYRHWNELDPLGRREAIRTIGQRAADMARLLDRLLAATTEPNRTAAPPVPFDLLDALREACRELSPDLRRRMRPQLPSTMPQAYGDRASLATVLTELVTNAAKYSEGEVELSADTDPQMVVFRVADRGIGIDPDCVEQAFDRYWQADSGGDRREHPGAGLGLYLVRRIVERQNGWVSLRPRKLGGTVAEVRLPRADVAEGGLR